MSYTLRDVVARFATQNPAVADSLMKKSGILETATFQTASHNVYHQGLKVNSDPTGSFIPAGGSVTAGASNDDIIKQDLFLCRSRQDVPIELANSYPGGKQKFFDDKWLSFIRGISQTAARQIIYGNTGLYDSSVSGFKGLHQIAKENGKVIQQGGTSAHRTTIFAVRWEPDLCSLIVNGNHIESGELVQVTKISNLEPKGIVTNATTGAEKYVYQVLYDLYLSLWAADSMNVAAYTQIQDDTSKKPLAGKMDLLLDMVKADPANTFLYGNRTSRRLLYELKDSKMQIMPSDSNYRTQIELWNGIPFYLEENIISVETSALD
jgi:hypothetical protein